MDDELDRRVELLRLAVLRRSAELANPHARQRFAANMTIVYRLEVQFVLGFVEDVLGLPRSASAEARSLASRITPRETPAVED